MELRKHAITDNEQFHYLGLIIGKDEGTGLSPRAQNQYRLAQVYTGSLRLLCRWTTCWATK